ncbi:hypothetical protein HNQ50_001430 [Silvimonas terrae]|uniref:Lysozyme inhibitor LprI N-terminal domain-containing protein n=1 Tax=Silvimonas terrae TaxID=300266 RepID=A0A840RDV6_9NEIS|nr:hypothetical protein [Silvimonas terrae]MBB5190708.1 hypothetical protein [Silvimonas terrae]
MKKLVTALLLSTAAATGFASDFSQPIAECQKLSFHVDVEKCLLGVIADEKKAITQLSDEQRNLLKQLPQSKKLFSLSDPVAKSAATYEKLVQLDCETLTGAAWSSGSGAGEAVLLCEANSRNTRVQQLTRFAQ